MAKLINCADCNRKISINADVCPSCGSPVQNQPNIQKQRVKQEKYAVRKAKDTVVYNYIAAVLFIILGSFGFDYSLFGALLIMLGGVLILPIIKRLIIEKKPMINRMLLSVVSGVLIISGFVVINSAMNESRENYLQENPEEAARIQKEQVEAESERQIAKAEAAAEARKNPTRYGMDKIYYQVVQDTIDQYNIAKNQGDAMQICVQAGLVSAAYLQAKNQEKYNEWKSIEKADCRAAGL